MTTENKSLKAIQDIIGSDFQCGDNCLYKEMENGYRVEVTGACNDTFKRHFNIYLIKDGVEIGQSTGVPQDKLAVEIKTLCGLSQF